ncbi:MAG: ABC transporter ATP-binding protein [Tepidisphaeraceae bacterium]|jgi:lipopolysaccharide transport system ATP-binding protein
MSSNGHPALDEGLVLSVRGVGKCYEIYAHPRHRVIQSLLGRRRKLYHEFWALRDVSFDVAEGQCVGIVGQNGAGKSTLLQIATGILAPTTGMVLSRGRVVSMLELGSGFNPEFTGRENVYLNASLLGLNQGQIGEKFEQIADFADIGQFIESPVKHYSSGMVARLAFAVYSSLDPRLLIVDEILSVGDAKFQAKCFRRIRELRDGGTSILLVSHSSEQIIQHCERAILLHQGHCVAIGEPRQVINQYTELLFGSEKTVQKPAGRQSLPGARPSPEAAVVVAPPADLPEHPFFRETGAEEMFDKRNTYNRYEHRWGNDEAHILDYLLVAQDGTAYPATVGMDSTVTLYLKVLAHRDIALPIFGLNIKTKEGLLLYGSNSLLAATPQQRRPLMAGQIEIVQFRWTVRYNGGDYLLSVGLASGASLDDAMPLDRRYDSILLPVLPSRRYIGLADMDLSVERFSAVS